MIYDAFILNEKADAVYYHGSQPVLKVLNVTTAATAANKSTILVEPGAPETGHSYYYQVANSFADLDSVVYGTAITTANWTALTANGLEITPGSGKTVVAIVETYTDSTSLMPVAYGNAILNIG